MLSEILIAYCTKGNTSPILEDCNPLVLPIGGSSEFHLLLAAKIREGHVSIITQADSSESSALQSFRIDESKLEEVGRHVYVLDGLVPVSTNPMDGLPLAVLVAAEGDALHDVGHLFLMEKRRYAR